MDWLKSKAYDDWKTSPPEEPESRLKCWCCGESIWPDDKYMDIEGETYCHYCAEDWFEGQWQKASEGDCL